MVQQKYVSGMGNVHHHGDGDHASYIEDYKEHGYVLQFYSFLVPSFYNLNLKVVHFCYFQNTFSFVSDDIGKRFRGAEYR